VPKPFVEITGRYDGWWPVGGQQLFEIELPACQ
jgi:hypothetical protein